MKKKLITGIITCAIIFSSVTLLYAWGNWGHKHISRSAVFALPPEMRTFYYNHLDFITEGAVVPDLRRALINDRYEAPRHYINIETFGNNVSIDALPKTVKEAYSKYDSAFLQKTGIVPWYIQSLMDKLTIAFQKKYKGDILFLSAELGHYIADANVPLHTSANHDGQLTNQKGIHAFWESRIPEMFGDKYNFYTGDAKYIDDITSEVWKIIKHSYSLVDTLLAEEKQLRSTFPKDKLYKKDDKGNNVLSYGQPVFSDEYTVAYNDALKGMVEMQMRSAIADVTNFWYTAWVNGGKPNLDAMDDPALSNQNKKNFKKEIKAWKSGRVLNLKTGEQE